jgi:Periplasmic protein involved in polysaccharide export
MRRLFVAGVVAIWLIHLNASGEEQLRQRPVYTLHIGDQIELNYRFTPEFNQTVTVQPDGDVVLNIVGVVRVAGLTIEQAHDQIVKRASDRLNKPELSITLAKFEQPYVVVAGEVDRPGKIDIRDNTTALQAILLAGGFKDSARDTKVILFRRINGDMAEVRPLNLHNVKKHADLERDTELEPGDMLLVTRNKMEHLSRFMKASNLGVYFNPITGLP